MGTTVRRVLWALVCCGAAYGSGARGAEGDIVVPRDFPTIQAAITAAPDGATIVVTKGTYPESLTIAGRTGLTIRGSGSPVVDAGGGGAAGFTITASDDVTVSGIVIRGADTGVSIEGSDRISVSRCRIVAPTTFGILAANASHLTIERNVVTDVGQRAMRIGGDGAVIDSLVTRNKVRRAGRAGIEIGGDRNTVERNSVVDAVRHAYETYSEPASSENVFAKNRSKGGEAGFRMHGARNTLTGNTVVKPGDVGVELEDDATGTLVEAQKVNKSALDGVVFYGPGNTLRKCKVVRSAGDGVRIDSDDNVVETTSIAKSGQAGLRMTPEAQGNIVRGSRAKASGTFDLHDEAGAEANTYEPGNKFRTTRFGP